MNRTERILIKVGVLVGIPVLAFAGLFLGNPHPASTQAVDTPTPTANASMTPTTSNSNIQSYEDLLARQLNVSVDQLRNAEAQARGQYFEQLVIAGVLNQSQAAALKASLPGEMFGRAILSALNPAPVKDAILGSAADVLGISQAQLEDELTSGKDLNQIAQEHNVSIDQLKTQLNQKATNLVSQAQGLGLLTPDEANNVTSQLQDRVNSLINKTFGQPANATATPTP